MVMKVEYDRNVWESRRILKVFRSCGKWNVYELSWYN